MLTNQHLRCLDPLPPSLAKMVLQFHNCCKRLDALLLLAVAYKCAQSTSVAFNTLARSVSIATPQAHQLLARPKVDAVVLVSLSYARAIANKGLKPSIPVGRIKGLFMPCAPQARTTAPIARSDSTVNSMLERARRTPLMFAADMCLAEAQRKKAVALPHESSRIRRTDPSPQVPGGVLRGGTGLDDRQGHNCPYTWIGESSTRGETTSRERKDRQSTQVGDFYLQKTSIRNPKYWTSISGNHQRLLF